VNQFECKHGTHKTDGQTDRKTPNQCIMLSTNDEVNTHLSTDTAHAHTHTHQMPLLKRL